MTTVIRLGRALHTTSWYTNYIVLVLTSAEMCYQVSLKEVAIMGFAPEDYHVDNELISIGSSLGGGLGNTNKLKVMNFLKAIKADRTCIGNRKKLTLTSEMYCMFAFLS